MDDLTKQDQVFVKEVAITGNQTQAAKKAYRIESDKYAGKKGSLLVAKGSIATAIAEVKRSLADRIPDELVVEKHIALLNKTEKKYNEDGDLVSEEIDTNAVRAGVDMSYKLKGAYAPEKNINLNIKGEITNPNAMKLAKEFEEKLKKSL